MYSSDCEHVTLGLTAIGEGRTWHCVWSLLARFVRHIRAKRWSLPHLLQVWPLAGQGLSV